MYIHTHLIYLYTYIHTYAYLTLYNEERRLGDQRGSDTLVVPLITSNDGLSIAFLTYRLCNTSSAYKIFTA